MNIKEKYIPRYVRSFQTGYLREMIQLFHERLKACDLCPRQCGVDRLAGETGYCRIGAHPKIVSYQPHYGEEEPLVGNTGSGTLFFSGCNLLCSFCQNYEISQANEGIDVSTDELADMMMYLKKHDCVNINLVTPTHVMPFVLSALEKAAADGLDIPLVYNTGGYDSADVLKHLDGIVDIYMPDFKFWDDRIASITAQAPDYRETVCSAIKEMHRQVGDLEMDERGLAFKGLLVRHLVLPKNKAGTREIMDFLAKDVSKNTYVNIMSQYRPCGKIANAPELTRRITKEEYKDALAAAKAAGIRRLDGRIRL